MWKHVDNRFVYESRTSSRAFSNFAALQPQQQQQPQQQPQQQTTADSGTFVDADGLPANGDVVAGVAQGGQIVSSGITQAYVIDSSVRLANLAGVYDRTINGISAGKVVLQYEKASKSFVMASTKSSELETL